MRYSVDWITCVRLLSDSAACVNNRIHVAVHEVIIYTSIQCHHVLQSCNTHLDGKEMIKLMTL